jgi:uncharacterized protein (TIGR03083 family)
MADVLPSLSVDGVWKVVDRERLRLADFMADLSDDEWNCPSLCAGWSVREVAAHLALAHTGPVAAAVGMVRARGSVDRMIHDTACRHAAVPTARLVAELRAMAGSRRRAPGVSHLEPMLDVLVHGQDVAVPLGRSLAMPVDAATAAATRVWTMGWPMSRAFRARTRLRGLELVASDTAWSAGEGLRVEGPVQALLLLLTGRAAAHDQLFGPGVPRLVRAAAQLPAS